MRHFDFDTYLSPLTWRYGSKEMRQIFSEENKYKLWRTIWVALARAQHKKGLISSSELKDLEKHKDSIDIARILEIEKDTKHDVVAAIREYAEKATVGGGKIHLGATSMDLVDNADMMRMMQALSITKSKVCDILAIFADKILQYEKTACMGHTHLQPAEPTTVGYRLSVYAQDLLLDLAFLRKLKAIIRTKGMKGATGTGASYVSLLGKKDFEEMEQLVMDEINLESSLITTQVYPRKFDYLILVLLASIGSSLAKFAADLRILTIPSIGEWSEPFGKKQVGSSAMPYKKNPLDSEKICSLARLVTQFPAVALENATHSYLERTLDDSSNKRIFMPEGFLATDEILETTKKILEGLVVNEVRIQHNLDQYGPFAATESIIIEAVKNGADRQEMHELLRTVSMQAWGSIQKGEKNPMKDLLIKNETLLQFVKEDIIIQLLNVSGHVGNAPERARKLAEKIKSTI